MHEDGTDQAPFVQVNPAQFQDMLGLFDRMQIEYSRNERWKQLILSSMLFEALALFDRLRWQEEQSLRRAPHQSPGTSTIWEIVHYIHQHDQEPLTLADLAKLFHFSVPNLSKLLKVQLGTSFIEFIHELRIRQACSLLRSSDMAITDIALEVGFRSFASFSRVFNHMKNVSPSVYRKKGANHSK